MKNKALRVISVALTILLAASSFAGCKKSTSQKVDLSKKVTLKIFMISDPPLNQSDTNQFLSKLDAMTTKDLNATVKIDYASGNNYETNYNLVLTSGEKYDLIYAANWLGYSTYAAKGAFLDLTNLVKKDCPDIYKTMPAEKWNAVKVNGKIYAVPNQNKASYEETAFMYREDLREKYNLPEINSVDTIQDYLEGIVKNDPSMIPSDDYLSQVYNCMFIPYSKKYEIVDVGADNSSNFVIDMNNPTKVLATIETPEYVPFMQLMKKWADMGFWSKSVLSSDQWGENDVINGKAAATFNAQFPNDTFQVPSLEKQHPGWKFGFLQYQNIGGEFQVHTNQSTQDVMAVTRTAENPDRALMLIDKLQTNKDYYLLTQYGIKGLNYNLTTDGKLSYDNVDLTKHQFGFFPSSAFVNSSLALDNSDAWPDYDSSIKALQKMTVTDPLDGFVLDTTQFNTQYTAINQTKTQYGNPLQAGLAGDVNTAYNTFLQKSKTAGLDTVRAQVEKELDAFLATKGIK